MVLEKQIPPFLDWFSAGFPTFLMLAAGLAVVGFFVGFLIAAVRDGPGVALLKTVRVAVTGWLEFRQLSFRRVWTMARLAIKEALRRHVLVVFAVFLVILLFAGWYLDVESDNPGRLYLSFVLKSTNFLLVLLAIFLSAFSLPNDIKNRTIYTVVTKPVRPWEIVLGRIVGFGVVCTVILGLMCLSSYLFVRRGLFHRHDVDVASVERVVGSQNSTMLKGRTRQEAHHRHGFEINKQRLQEDDTETVDEFVGQTDSRMGHFHAVSADGETGEQFSVGSPAGTLIARVPIYGGLRFLDRTGKPAEKGTNIGKEWTYRGYIAGGTFAAGIWKFDDLKPRDFPQGLPLEMTIRVFRTFKGEIERGILGSLLIRNPNPALRTTDPGEESQLDADTAVESEEIPITATDFTPFRLTIPRRISARMASDDSYREVDLFESLAHEGQVEVVIRCAERGQYYGLATTDLFVRSANRMFWLNFAKTFATTWLQLIVVISFGVMFSTLVNGPVAMLATLGSMVMGYFSQTIVDVATGELVGGGPGESAIRMFRQEGVVTDLGEGAATKVVQAIDAVILFFMRGVAYVMPNFRDYAEHGGMNTTRFVAYGFDIPASLMGQHAMTALAYVLIATCAAYYFLKTKEIAA